MRLTWLVLLLGLIAPSIQGQVRVETGFLDRTVTLEGQRYRYQVYVPVEYSSQAKWPVLIDLHGAAARGADGLLQTDRAVASQVRRDRSRFPVIVVMPQAPAGKGFGYPEMQDVVAAQLEQTIREYSVDENRVYLFGYSMGASGAYRTAARWPERFADLVAIAGEVDITKTNSEAAVQADKGNPFTQEHDQFAALASRIRLIPTWLIHGDADETNGVEQSRQLSAALKRSGEHSKYTEYPGANHVGTAETAYADPDVWTWLFAQRRIVVAHR